MKHFTPSQQGYRILYHEGRENPCPGCSRSNWHVGRMSAECAFCETALPLAPIEALRREIGA